MLLRIVHTFSISLAFFLLSGFFPDPSISAEEDTTRHEITGGIKWLSDEYTYDHYITNGEFHPTKSEEGEKQYWLGTSSYSFFFSPVPDKQETPIALRRFYAHPTTVTINFSIQESTYRHRDLTLNQFHETTKDEKSRSAGLDFEYYITRNTGLVFHLRSTENEQDVRTVWTPLNSQAIGENDEIQRYYGLGISQFIFDSLNLSVSYTLLDFDYVGSERSWSEDNPLLFTDDFRDTETTGKRIVLEGEYVYRKFLGVRGSYEFCDQKAHSKTQSWYYENFPGIEISYDDDLERHTLGTLLSLYLGERTTFRIGGSYGKQQLEQVYKRDHITEYDGDILTVETNILHYLNRHIGLQIGYEFTTRDGDVLVWHPKSENDPRTTYEFEADLHAVYAGIVGRF
jgi:hypothetical protein